MKYKFNLKLQAAYGITSFLACVAVLYLFGWNSGSLISAAIIGAVNFVVAGFYDYKNWK